MIRLNNSCLPQYIDFINNVLNVLYAEENELFEHNLCERAIVFRFAHHLQNEMKGYWVDCDYNSSHVKKGNCYVHQHGKSISNPNWEQIWRFIDIIVRSKRIPDDSNTDIICFECKKWNNCTADGIEKDKNNLKTLTRNYGYQYWFHLIFWKKKEDTKIEVYQQGEIKWYIMYIENSFKYTLEI
mgnify:CR=1 FL=1